MSNEYETNPAVKNLRNYLRIRSVHPNINYDECIEYLKNQAKSLGLPIQVHEVLPKKPILIMTWVGEEPELPSVLLNSHMDVVPVFEESWKHPPFAADLEDGVIYARDEEIGGGTGMAPFMKTQAFKDLNVGFALDEGIACATEDFLVFNGERTIWHVKIICPGMSGHGSLLLPDNCGEKLRYMIDKFMDLRRESKEKLAQNPELNIGDVTSVNLTMVSGGIQNNVVPEKMTASFDIRIALSVDLEQFENTIKRWCSEAGDNVTYEFEQKDPYTPSTKVDDSNPFWIAFKSAADQQKLSIKVRTFPGGTDSRYLREVSVPALGFSPMAGIKPGLHEHNECLPVETFLRGITIYEAILPAVANA